MGTVDVVQSPDFVVDGRIGVIVPVM